MSSIDNLNFKVILDDADFNDKVDRDIDLAKKLNTSLSSLLEAKSKIPQNMKLSVDTKDAQASLERLNAYFAELEKADLTKVGEKLNVAPQVEQALIQLRKLEEEIEVIQELRQEEGGDMGLALELKNAQEQAKRLLATIAELRKVEAAVNAPSQFSSHIRSLTEQSLAMQRLIEYYKAEEKAAEEVAKEKAKEEKERKKNAVAIEKERRAMANGAFKEHIQGLTRANPTLKQMATYYRELERETAKHANAAAGAAIHQERLNQNLKKTSRLAREVKSALTGIFSIYAARELVSSLVKITGEFEMQKTTLAAMLGDLNKAEKILTRIQGLAVESPFQFKELTTYAKQLSAFSVPAEELYETTKMLADVSAGLGVGMDRIVLAYGQVRSAAFLRGQEVRQFTEAGIPILEELAKQFEAIEGRAVSAGEVFDKISARLVPFEMVAKVFKDMTSEGGKFYNMQEIQAETLAGKLSNLKDAYEMMLNEIGSAHVDKLKGGVDALRELMKNWEQIGRGIVDAIKVLGAFKVAMGAMKLLNAIQDIGSLKKAIEKAVVAQKALNAAVLANPYAALAAVISLVGVQLIRMSRSAKEAKRELDQIAQTQFTEAEKAAHRYEELVDRLNGATQGSHNYREAINDLNREFGEYLPNLLNEKNALDEVKSSSDAVTQSIYNRAKARAYEKAQEKVEEDYGGSRDFYAATFMNKLKESGIGEQAARDLFVKFNEEIKKQSGEWNPAEVFNKVYQEYFKTTEEYFGGVSDFFNNIKQEIPGLTSAYGRALATDWWVTARDALWNYSLVLDDINKAEQANKDILESKWGTAAKSELEARKVEQITKWYNRQKAAIDGAAMSEQERAERLKMLDVSKVQLLVQLYEELEKDPGTARTDKLKQYRDELADLTKDLTGWQKLVQDALKPFGVKTKGPGDYGLFPEENDEYLEYVKELRESYGGLEQKIKDTKKAAPELSKEYEKQKQLIEAVAKALSIELNPSDKSGGKSKAQKDLEGQIALVKQLQDAYNKLRPYVDDKVMKDTLAKYFPKAKKEWIESLDFTGVLEKMATMLERYDKEAAERLRNSIGKSGIDKEVQKYKDAEKRIMDQISALQKLQNQYERLKAESVSDEEIAELFRNLYPDLIEQEGADFVTDLKYLERAINLTKELERLSPDKAKKALIDLGADGYSVFLKKTKEQNDAYKKSAKAAGEYFEALRKWASEDYSINGEGIALDISKIASDLNSAVAEVDVKAKKIKEIFGQIDIDSDKDIKEVKRLFVKEFGEDAWIDFWNSYRLEGASAIDELAERQMEYEKKLAQEKVNDLAQKYVKESYFTEGIKLDELGEKTYRQLHSIRKRLQEVANSEPLKLPAEVEINMAGVGVDVNDLLGVDLDTTFNLLEVLGQPIDEATQSTIRLMQQIQQAGLSTEQFGEAIQKVFKGDLSKLADQEAQALSNLTREYVSLIGSLGDKLAELGNNLGDSGLAGFGKSIKQIEELAGILTECDSFMKMFVDTSGKAAEQVSEVVEETGELAESSGDAAENLKEVGNSSDWITMVVKLAVSLFTQVIDGINGSIEATQRAKEAAMEYAHSLKEIELDNLMGSFDTMWGTDSFGKAKASLVEAQKYMQLAKEYATEAGTSQRELASKNASTWGYWFSKKYRNQFKELTEFDEGNIFVDMRNGWQKYWGTGLKNIKKLNISDFIDTDGNIMGEELQALLDTYGDDMSKETKASLQAVLNEYDLFVKAMEQTNSYLSEMFSNVASQMADSFVDSFKKTGEAAMDYESIMDDVATNVAKSIVQSMIIEELVDPEKLKAISEMLLSGDEVGAMAVVDETMKSAQALAPKIQELLEGFEPYFQMETEVDGQSLADGIKGITEDTANLLASYLNAIRADVSYGKAQWAQMNIHLQQISNMLSGFSAPSLMEYQQQIAANTLNTAITTQDILSRLDSVLTSEGGASAIRIYS